MSEKNPSDEDTAASDRETDIVYAEITPDPSTAEYDLLELIADMESVEIEELPSLYTEVDHFVEKLFDEPPSPDAQLEVQFSYAGYRITIAQDGQVKFVPVKETLDE